MNAVSPLWYAEEVRAAAKGSLSAGTHDWTASGVSIDSRSCDEGDLFVAISGENFDGHEFVGRAFDAGASAAIVSRVPEGIGADRNLLMVDDTQAALESLGRAGRDRTNARVVAVTGSVGKTGTKEALTLAFGALGTIHSTVGNLNNHIGVPLTLARMPRESDYAVIEMGMNHPGEISPLSRFTHPDVAIITTIAAVHLEFFDHVAEIADAKAEIFDGIAADGTAVLNRDNVYFAVLVARAWSHGVKHIIGFGAHPEAEVRLSAYAETAEGSDVTATIRGETVRYRLNVPGRHWVQNSLAVLASVNALGGDLDHAAEALAQLKAPRGRGARSEIHLHGDTLTVIDDSYNASPASMRAAISVLASSKPHGGGRRIAVLGDMLELGDTAPQLHAALARELEASDIDLVFCAGPNMRELHAALTPQVRGGHAEDSTALAPIVADAVRAGDVVMVKGSLGSRMAAVVEALNTLDMSRHDIGEPRHAV